MSTYKALANWHKYTGPQLYFPTILYISFKNSSSFLHFQIICIILQIRHTAVFPAVNMFCLSLFLCCLLVICKRLQLLNYILLFYSSILPPSYRNFHLHLATIFDKMYWLDALLRMALYCLRKSQESPATRAIAGFCPSVKSSEKAALTTRMATDRKIFHFLPHRGIMAEIEYPGIAKLVSRLIWVCRGAIRDGSGRNAAKPCGTCVFGISPSR